MNDVSNLIDNINRDRLLDRFIKYVKVDTAADPSSFRYPSSAGQLELGKIVLDEMIEMGVTDAHQDHNGLVWGTIPSNSGEDAPTVAFVAHLDTSPEAPSENVRPQVVASYAGGDLLFENGAKLTVQECPELQQLVGKTLICSAGDTLLGGDDKAGVAIIMELAQSLLENPSLQHGTIKLLMTCDEEIGRGTDKIDLAKLDATVAYTIDGGGSGILDVETFSADAATVLFTGHNIHPAIAKGRMINAVRAAGEYIASLPKEGYTPETTDQRDGFIHAYQISGGVGEARIELLLRSFEKEELQKYAGILSAICEQTKQKFPGLSIHLEIKKQYRNLKDGLRHLPQAIDLPVRAFKKLGRPFEKAIIRGGTDGSQLTEKGLPTPNLSSGQYQIHSVREFACLDQMVEAIEHLQILVALWAEEKQEP